MMKKPVLKLSEILYWKDLGRILKARARFVEARCKFLGGFLVALSLNPVLADQLSRLQAAPKASRIHRNTFI